VTSLFISFDLKFTHALSTATIVIIWSTLSGDGIEPGREKDIGSVDPKNVPDVNEF
jgi:hypothetical protein